MKYYVSRQQYWHTGDCVVEIAGGGTDYANPDMLVSQFPELGEGLEYTDPRKALRAAIAIRDAWQKSCGKDVRVEYGCTMGFTMPFEEEPSDEELLEWAEKAWENTPKCEQCGDPLPSETDFYYIPDLGNEFKFCSENCVDTFYFTSYSDLVAEQEG